MWSQVLLLNVVNDYTRHIFLQILLLDVVNYYMHHKIIMVQPMKANGLINLDDMHYPFSRFGYNFLIIKGK